MTKRLEAIHALRKEVAGYNERADSRMRDKFASDAVQERAAVTVDLTGVILNRLDKILGMEE